jgi:transcriptional regulator with XRE-family HTH domain
MNASSPSDGFSSRLKTARETRQLSQAELASLADLQASAISHFETGTRKPSFANLRRLADALDVSTDYLLGRSETMSGSATVDVLFRDVDRLSGRDLDTIRSLAAHMAAQKNKGERGGEGT